MLGAFGSVVNGAYFHSLSIRFLNAFMWGPKLPCSKMMPYALNRHFNKNTDSEIKVYKAERVFFFRGTHNVRDELQLSHFVG